MTIERDDMVAVSYERIVTETDKAILFEIDGEEVWLPKSQIEETEKITFTVWVPLWLAEKNDLNYS